jgi:hypothetical protein
MNKLLENEDIKRHIFSFGTIEHRQWMRRLCLGYDKSNPAIHYLGPELLSPIPRLFLEMPHREDDDEKQDLDVSLDGYTLLETLIWFYKFRRCQCCSRHSHRKHNIFIRDGFLVYTKGDSGPRIPEDKNMGDCDCDCRHNMRYLFRCIKRRM